MNGRMVSHYRILSPLGSGGMGVVYLAEDERLGRQVALKFLPSAWSHERKALERFRVEARAASSLSHPAICAIFDIGQDGDVPFIVMEALKGETLRDRIARGPLKVTDVLDIGIQLADALGAAHDQGIVHRDIKPANIFISDKNRVKVLDFGLAKLTSSASHLTSGADTTSPATMRTVDNQITIPGTALGTVSYMSPEQARGEDVDARTDLFSLGAVLYEMVTGSQAFGGSTTAVVYDAILNRSPRPISRLNPLVPPRLESLIATALEKDREFRQQHASDLEAELKRIRRDLDSASRINTQTSQAAADAPAPTVITPSPATEAPKRGWETAAALVAVVALLLVGAWVWRDIATQPVQPDSSAATSAGPTPPAAVVTQTQPPVATQTPPPTAAQEPPPQLEARAPQATPPPPPPRQEPTPRVPPRDASRDSAPPQPRNEPPRVRDVPPPAAPVEIVAPPTQPATSDAPSRGGAPTGGPTLAPAPTPSVAPPPSTPAPQASSPSPSPAAAPPPSPAPQTTPQAPATAPAATPPPAATPRPQAEAQAPAPSAPVESDEAAIRRVVRTFQRAIETKDLALYRSVRRLSPEEESTLRETFRAPVNQEVEIRVDSVRVDGRTATARVTQRVTLVNSGRRHTENSALTLRFEKTETGWIIAN